jgi:hypothetical protein
MRWPLVRTAAGAAVLFGLLTLASGGATLLGSVDSGAVVPFVLWFNFLAGFAYIAAGGLLWLGSRWAFPVAAAILAATVLVFLFFGLHAAGGGAYETRTIGAMTFRTVFWIILAAVAWKAEANLGPPRNRAPGASAR